MTVNIANTANNNTFDYWRNRTNELAYTMSVYAVTANGSNAAVGNAAITGILFANSMVLSANAVVNTTIRVGNNSVSPDANIVFINETSISIGNTSVNTFIDTESINTYALYLGSNVVANTSHVYIGNTSVNLNITQEKLELRNNPNVLIVNNSLIHISNSSGIANLTPIALTMDTSVVNSTVITTGAGGFTANTSAIKVGSNVIVNTSLMVIGNSTVNTISNSSTFLVSGNTTSPAVSVNSTGFVAGDTSLSGAPLARIANSSGNTTINPLSISTSWGVTANSSGVFTTNVTSNVYALQIATGTGTTNTFSNSIVFVAANSTSQTVISANGIVANGGLTTYGESEFKTNAYVRGNLVVNGNLLYTGVSVGDFVPGAANLTIGNTTVYWNTVYAQTYYSTTNSYFYDSTTVNNTIVVGSNVSNTIITRNSISVNGNITVNTSGVFVSNSSGIVNVATVSVGNTFLTNTIVNTNFVSTGNIHIGNSTNYVDFGVNAAANGIYMHIGNTSANITISIPSQPVQDAGSYWLNANGIWAVISSPLSTNTVPTTGTNSQIIDSYPVGSNGVEYLLTVSDTANNLNRLITKILVIATTVLPYSTEYGAVASGANVGVFTVNTASNSTHFDLNFTPTVSNTTVKYVRTVV